MLAPAGQQMKGSGSWGDGKQGKPFAEENPWKNAPRQSYQKTVWTGQGWVDKGSHDSKAHLTSEASLAKQRG
jgi:hypothetical protein